MSGDLINQPELYESSGISEEKKDRLRVATGDLVAGKDYDRIDATYPSNIKEIYTYTLAAITVAIIEVTYVSSAKKDILNVVYT